MSLQKQTFFQKLFTKQMAWLSRACSTDSIDIKFANFGRVDQKLCNLQNWKSNRSNLSFKSTYMPRVMFLLVHTGSVWITLQTVGSKQVTWPRTRTPSLLSDSILSTRSGSDGCCEFDPKRAALRRWLALERPDGGGAG